MVSVSFFLSQEERRGGGRERRNKRRRTTPSKRQKTRRECHPSHNSVTPLSHITPLGRKLSHGRLFICPSPIPVQISHLKIYINRSRLRISSFGPLSPISPRHSSFVTSVTLSLCHTPFSISQSHPATSHSPARPRCSPPTTDTNTTTDNDGDGLCTNVPLQCPHTPASCLPNANLALFTRRIDSDMPPQCTWKNPCHSSSTPFLQVTP